ncbi:hypothetical protein BJ508DRAFT_337105, partial [Ascobolus immersus RN42]
MTQQIMSSSGEEVDLDRQETVDFANEYLRDAYDLFLEKTIDDEYRCKECRKSYRRPNRILAHYEKQHFMRLQGIVQHRQIELDNGDEMDIDGGNQNEDPRLAAAFQRYTQASSNVRTTRDILEAPPIKETAAGAGPGADDDPQHERNNSEKYPDRLVVEKVVPDELNLTKTLLEEPWHPFINGREYAMARWFFEAGVGKTHINAYFNYGLGDVEGFTSAYDFQKLLEEMHCNPGHEYGDTLKQWRDGYVNFPENGIDHEHIFHYRLLEPTIQRFFEEPWFQDKLIFLPEKKIRPDGVRVFTEMHTGDWWWNLQAAIDEEIGPGHFVIPILFGSDETHLTNFSGDKAVWP